MPDSIDDLIPNANQIRKEAALREAEKAEKRQRNTRVLRLPWNPRNGR